MNEDKNSLDRLSEQIIGCAFAVGNGLGPGFLEKIYQNALVFELRSRDLTAEQHRAIVVTWRGTVMGDYVADIVVENSVIIEVKATRNIDPAHLAQCRNYLKATGLRLCLLINFGSPRVEVRRIALDL